MKHIFHNMKYENINIILNNINVLNYHYYTKINKNIII